MSKKLYVHLEREHNMDDPDEIVPLLYDIFSPQSVVDIGCGIGNFLFKFKECGVKNVTGFDGAWSRNDLQMLKDEELITCDLSKPLPLSGKFDLAVSFEVAEHLQQEYAEKIINDLTAISNTVVFSAALPAQGGQNHINEQWPEYWVKLFNAKDFVCYDALRPLIWNNPKIKFWYKQNMFVAVHTSNFERIEHLQSNFPFIKNRENIVHSMVHPDLFDVKVKRINRLVKMMKGRASFDEYKEEISKIFNRSYR